METNNQNKKIFSLSEEEKKIMDDFIKKSEERFLDYWRILFSQNKNDNQDNTINKDENSR